MLPFLRERIASATDNYRPSYVSTLFDTLLGWKWSDAIESEAFATWHHLADAAEPGTTDPLVIEVPALYRLVDSMIANRQAAAKEKLHDAGSVDKLTRTELAPSSPNSAKRLATASPRGWPPKPRRSHGSLEPWLRIEQSYLDVQLDRNLDDIAARCWKILGEAPPKQDAAAEPAEELSPVQLQQRAFEALLRQRAFVTVMNLAARRDAKPAAIERLLKYIQAGIAQGGDAAARWRTAEFQLLVALIGPTIWNANCAHGFGPT